MWRRIWITNKQTKIKTQPIADRDKCLPFRCIPKKWPEIRLNFALNLHEIARFRFFGLLFNKKNMLEKNKLLCYSFRGGFCSLYFAHICDIVTDGIYLDPCVFLSQRAFTWNISCLLVRVDATETALASPILHLFVCDAVLTHLKFNSNNCLSPTFQIFSYLIVCYSFRTIRRKALLSNCNLKWSMNKVQINDYN